MFGGRLLAWLPGLKAGYTASLRFTLHCLETYIEALKERWVQATPWARHCWDCAMLWAVLSVTAWGSGHGRTWQPQQQISDITSQV